MRYCVHDAVYVLYYLPLHLVAPEFLFSLPVILQEKYPSSKVLRIGM